MRLQRIDRRRERRGCFGKSSKIISRSSGKDRLVTDRPPYLMCAADGTFVEVFEWKSAAAIETAHHNAAVQAMWARFEEACTYESLVSLSESKEMFANFESVEL